MAGQNGVGSNYRRHILQQLPSLHHLDLKRVTDHDLDFSSKNPKTSVASSNKRLSGVGTVLPNNSGSSTSSNVSGVCPIVPPKTSAAKAIDGNSSDGLPILTDNAPNGHPHEGNPNNASPGIERRHHGLSPESGNGNGDIRYVSRTRIGALGPRPPSGTSSTNGKSSPSRNVQQKTAANGAVREQVEY